MCAHQYCECSIVFLQYHCYIVMYCSYRGRVYTQKGILFVWVPVQLLLGKQETCICTDRCRTSVQSLQRQMVYAIFCWYHEYDNSDFLVLMWCYFLVANVGVHVGLSRNVYLCYTASSLVIQFSLVHMPNWLSLHGMFVTCCSNVVKLASWRG